MKQINSSRGIFYPVVDCEVLVRTDPMAVRRSMFRRTLLQISLIKEVNDLCCMCWINLTELSIFEAKR